MRAPSARRARARVAHVVVSAFASAAFAGAAFASAAFASAAFAAPAGAATLQVANNTVTPEQAVPVQLAFSGTADTGSNSFLEAVARTGGSLSCQDTYASDLSFAGSADTVIFGPSDQSVSPGSFQVTTSFKPPTAGPYEVCAWLTQEVNGATETVAGPSTVTFTARQPQVSTLSVTLPQAAMPDLAFEIDYTTQTDQQLNLYSVIKKAGGLPCASSFELEQQQTQSESTLFGTGRQQVFGGPTTTSLTDEEPTGSYLICSWIEGPSSGEVDDSLSTPVTVGTPAPTINQAKLALRLSTATASRAHGIAVAGVTAKDFTGRLVVLASCGSSRNAAATVKPKATKGRFSTHLALPRGCRGKRHITVKATWAGSKAFAPAAATKSVAIRA